MSASDSACVAFARSLLTLETGGVTRGALPSGAADEARLPAPGVGRCGTIGGGVASSADGTRLLAAAGDQIYASADSGKTWTPTDAPSAAWVALASSADSYRIVAASGDGLIGAFPYSGLWRLADAPGETVRLLQQHLKPTVVENPKTIRRLIADLDDDMFAVREAAQAALAKRGAVAEPVLRENLNHNPSPEARRRIEGLLSNSTSHVRDPEMLRRLRAVQVLEQLLKSFQTCGMAERQRIENKMQVSMADFRKSYVPVPVRRDDHEVIAAVVARVHLGR